MFIFFFSKINLLQYLTYSNSSQRKHTFHDSSKIQNFKCTNCTFPRNNGIIRGINLLLVIKLGRRLMTYNSLIDQDVSVY